MVCLRSTRRRFPYCAKPDWWIAVLVCERCEHYWRCGRAPRESPSSALVVDALVIRERACCLLRFAARSVASTSRTPPVRIVIMVILPLLQVGFGTAHLKPALRFSVRRHAECKEVTPDALVLSVRWRTDGFLTCSRGLGPRMQLFRRVDIQCWRRFAASANRRVQLRVRSSSCQRDVRRIIVATPAIARGSHHG